MTITLRQKLLALCSASVLVLAACGGGGSATDTSTTVTPPATPPTTTTDTSDPVTYVTVQGEITGFGSIIVNGTRYETDTAEVNKDDEDATVSDLSIGQIVSIRAQKNGDDEAPTALRVRYEEELEGPISAVAADASSVTVLGLTVLFTDQTIFEDGLVATDLAEDDVIEVSGRYDSDGALVASYVEISDDTDSDYELHGTVSNLDETAQTFTLRGLTVGYASAALEDFEDGNVLSNGDKVEVEGSVFQNDGTLIATRIEYEGDDLAELRGDEATENDVEEFEVEGRITAFESADLFEVEGQVVLTTETTEFERCSPNTIGLGLEVEVEGTLDSEGRLVAEEVECEVEPNIAFRGFVDEVDVNGGLLNLLGALVTVVDDTSFQDRSATAEREFGLSDINVGDFVEIQAYQLDDDATVYASRMTRVTYDEGQDMLVEGPVGVIGAETFDILGVNVILTANTIFRIDGEFSDFQTFMSEIEVGDTLSVEGPEDGDRNRIFANYVSFESDDDEGGED